MRILLKGLGPKESITYEGQLLKNGAAVEMKEQHAKAYLDAGIAYLVQSEEEVQAAQALEKKNAATRDRILKKAAQIEKQEETEEKKGGTRE